MGGRCLRLGLDRLMVGEEEGGKMMIKKLILIGLLAMSSGCANKVLYVHEDGRRGECNYGILWGAGGCIGASIGEAIRSECIEKYGKEGFRKVEREEGK